MKKGVQPNQRTARKARRLDREKVLDLHAKGLSTAEIAQHQQVAPSTIWRFLAQSRPERAALEQFKQHRGDVFAKLAAKSLDVQDKILDTLDDRVLNGLAPHQKTGLLHVLTIQSGTLYDKERLERGESTSNLSVVSRMVDASVSSLYKRKAASEPQQGVGSSVQAEG